PRAVATQSSRRDVHDTVSWPLPGKVLLDNTVDMTRPSTEVVLRGREAELLSVVRLLHAATEGRGGALVFAGDVGTGKSALLAAAMNQAAGFTVVEACGWQSQTELPYAGLTRVLERVVSRRPPEGAHALLHSLADPPDAPVDQLAVSSAFLALLV